MNEDKQINLNERRYWRLDKDRQQRLEPQRIEHALNKFESLGIHIHYHNETTIFFYWKGEECKFYPYSGWHTGKTIKDGRGINKLLKQLKKE